MRYYEYEDDFNIVKHTAGKPEGTVAMDLLKEAYPALYDKVLHDPKVNAYGAKHTTRFFAYVLKNWGAGPAERGTRKRTIKTMQWVAPRVLHQYADGWKMVRLWHPADLMQWGKTMAHCGWSHGRWVNINIRFFLTLLDPDGVCHGTIDLRPVGWLRKQYARGAQNDTAYDYDGYKATLGLVDIEGHTAQIVSVSAGYGRFEPDDDIGRGATMGRYNDKFTEWLNANKVVGRKELFLTPPGLRVDAKTGWSAGPKVLTELHPVAGATIVMRGNEPQPADEGIRVVAYIDGNGRAHDQRGRFVAAARA